MKTETHFVLLVLVTLRSPDFDALFGDTEVSLKVWLLATGVVGHQKASLLHRCPHRMLLAYQSTIPSETRQIKDTGECKAYPPCRVIQSGIHWPRWSVPHTPAGWTPPPYMRYSPPCTAFFALRVELCVGLDGVSATLASGWARFLFKTPRSASESRQTTVGIMRKTRGITLGGISALFVRTRLQVSNPSMLKKRDNA